MQEVAQFIDSDGDIAMTLDCSAWKTPLLPGLQGKASLTPAILESLGVWSSTTTYDSDSISHGKMRIQAVRSQLK